jgi:hypothetical protein
MPTPSSVSLDSRFRGNDDAERVVRHDHKSLSESWSAGFSLLFPVIKSPHSGGFWIVSRTSGGATYMLSGFGCLALRSRGACSYQSGAHEMPTTKPTPRS